MTKDENKDFSTEYWLLTAFRRFGADPRTRRTRDHNSTALWRQRMGWYSGLAVEDGLRLISFLLFYILSNQWAQCTEKRGGGFPCGIYIVSLPGWSKWCGGGRVSRLGGCRPYKRASPPPSSCFSFLMRSNTKSDNPIEAPTKASEVRVSTSSLH